MKSAILNLALSAALIGSGVEAQVFSETPQGFELIANDGSLLARIFNNRDSVLLDFPSAQRGFLFKSESCFYLNRENKTYSAHSYADIIRNVQSWSEADESSKGSNAGLAGFILTGETDVVAGLWTTKIVSESKNRGTIEIWLSEETPAALKTVGREIRAVLPSNYWSEHIRGPSLFQIVLVFGLPMKIINYLGESCALEAVQMKAEDIPAQFSDLPQDYRSLRESLRN